MRLYVRFRVSRKLCHLHNRAVLSLHIFHVSMFKSTTVWKLSPSWQEANTSTVQTHFSIWVPLCIIPTSMLTFLALIILLLTTSWPHLSCSYPAQRMRLQSPSADKDSAGCWHSTPQKGTNLTSLNFCSLLSRKCSLHVHMSMPQRKEDNVALYCSMCAQQSWTLLCICKVQHGLQWEGSGTLCLQICSYQTE